MDDTDRIVAAIFTAAMCGRHPDDFAAYFRTYDYFLAMMRDREKQAGPSSHAKSDGAPAPPGSTGMAGGKLISF